MKVFYIDYGLKDDQVLLVGQEARSAYQMEYPQNKSNMIARA
jgi:hypothetical protein